LFGPEIQSKPIIIKPIVVKPIFVKPIVAKPILPKKKILSTNVSYELKHYLLNIPFLLNLNNKQVEITETVIKRILSFICTLMIILKQI
jgi:hypothetical protein